jgi:membrane protein YqaA with SNARE-associated domain
MEISDQSDSIIEKVLATDTAGKAQQLMRSKYGLSLLALVSLLESFLPLPILTDPFLMAAIMVNRTRVWSLVFFAMISSVIGGFLAYLVALLFRELLLSSLTPDMLATLESLVAGEAQGTFILTILGAVSPVPYTIIAWAVALTAGNPLVFILGSVVGRTFRYGVVGWCTYKFGPVAWAYAKRSLLLTSAVIFIVAGLYVWTKM